MADIIMISDDEDSHGHDGGMVERTQPVQEDKTIGFRDVQSSKGKDSPMPSAPENSTEERALNLQNRSNVKTFLSHESPSKSSAISCDRSRMVDSYGVQINNSQNSLVEDVVDVEDDQSEDFVITDDSFRIVESISMRVSSKKNSEPDIPEPDTFVMECELGETSPMKNPFVGNSQGLISMPVLTPEASFVSKKQKCAKNLFTSEFNDKQPSSEKLCLKAPHNESVIKDSSAALRDSHFDPEDSSDVVIIDDDCTVVESVPSSQMPQNTTDRTEPILKALPYALNMSNGKDFYVVQSSPVRDIPEKVCKTNVSQRPQEPPSVEQSPFNRTEPVLATLQSIPLHMLNQRDYSVVEPLTVRDRSERVCEMNVSQMPQESQIPSHSLVQSFSDRTEPLLAALPLNPLNMLNQKGYFQCCVGPCSYNTFWSKAFEQHLVNSHDRIEAFVCVHCGHVSRTNQEFFLHMDDHIVDVKMLCNYPNCSSYSRSLDEYMMHIHLVHEQSDDHLCFHCNEVFDSVFSLMVHMKSTSLKVVRCVLCSATDVSKERIINHFQSSHPQERTSKMHSTTSYLLCKQRLMNEWPMVPLSRLQTVLTNSSPAETEINDVAKERSKLFPPKIISPSLQYPERQTMNNVIPFSQNVSSDVLRSSITDRGSTFSEQQYPNPLDGEMSVYCPSAHQSTSSKHDPVQPQNDISGPDNQIQPRRELKQIQPRRQFNQIQPTGVQKGDSLVCNYDDIYLDTDADDESEVMVVDILGESEPNEYCSLPEIALSGEEADNETDQMNEAEETVLTKEQLPKNSKSYQLLLFCRRCDFFTTAMPIMYNHVREIHNLKEVFKCSDCDEVLTQDEMMDHHELFHPNSDESYLKTPLCHSFGEGFLLRSTYKQKMKNNEPILHPQHFYGSRQNSFTPSIPFKAVRRRPRKFSQKEVRRENKRGKGKGVSEFLNKRTEDNNQKRVGRSIQQIIEKAKRGRGRPLKSSFKSVTETKRGSLKRGSQSTSGKGRPVKQYLCSVGEFHKKHLSQHHTVKKRGRPFRSSLPTRGSSSVVSRGGTIRGQGRGSNNRGQGAGKNQTGLGRGSKRGRGTDRNQRGRGRPKTPVPERIEDVTEVRLLEWRELYYFTTDEKGDEAFQCLKCDYLCTNRTTMRSHSHKHQNKLFKCIYCAFRSYPRGRVVAHQQKWHPGRAIDVVNLLES